MGRVRASLHSGGGGVGKSSLIPTKGKRKKGKKGKRKKGKKGNRERGGGSVGKVEAMLKGWGAQFCLPDPHFSNFVDPSPHLPHNY